jgi:DNA topoisomerase I
MDKPNFGRNHRWKHLEHNGVAFPPSHVHRGIAITISGNRLVLDRDQEEVVYAWAKKKDTHYIKDPVFQLNFLNYFRKLLPDRFQSIKNISEIDMSEAFSLVDEESKAKEVEKERLRSLPKEERKRRSLERKAEREKMKSIYGKAKVDNIEVDVANWLVEPPGIFMGRGQHPLRGFWKPRVSHNDVILNLSENSPVPEGPWKNIVHDHSSTWLATWIEKLTNKRKYVWLHDSASIRQDNDRDKYDKANKLENYIDKVDKEIIERMINSRDIYKRKVATVCYLIHKLAMRVGDEKDPDEADTVGASTLRVEHIKFPSVDGNPSIEFNFLGKDSVPWQKTIMVSSEDTKGLYENLVLFMKNKNDKEKIFPEITSAKVNAFLRSINRRNLPFLTAKVFRTYVATDVVKKSLQRPIILVDKNSTDSKKIYVAKIANLKAAITCNHKKGVDPNNPASKIALEKFQLSVEKKKEKINILSKELYERKWKSEVQRRKAEERIEKLKYQLKLQIETKDYNLGTSLRNYIDPRTFKSWADYVGLDWTKIYTATLQRKFKWVEQYTSSQLDKYLEIQNVSQISEMISET